MMVHRCEAEGCDVIADKETATLEWLVVGWLDGPTYEVHSADCARVVVDELAARLAVMATRQTG